MNRKRNQNALGIEWGTFYKTIIGLVVPMALQNLINVGVTAADVIMLGAVGETALSGASLAGQVQYIMTLFLFGLTSGATVLTAQYWGKGDRKTIEKILGMTVKAAVLVTAVFTAAALVIPQYLMMIFTADPAHCCIYLYHDRCNAGLSLCHAQCGACGRGYGCLPMLPDLQYHHELHLYLRALRAAGNGGVRSGAGNSVRAYSGGDPDGGLRKAL